MLSESKLCKTLGCNQTRAPGCVYCWDHVHPHCTDEPKEASYTKQQLVKLIRESQDPIWQRNYRYDIMKWVRENLE